MEFVLVTFPTLRAVRLDGAQQGQTGQIIGVQRGTHLFDLGTPQDYTPPLVQTVVANTSQIPAARDSVSAGGAAGARRRATARKRTNGWRRAEPAGREAAREEARRPEKRRWGQEGSAREKEAGAEAGKP